MEDADKREMGIEETRDFWKVASTFPADKEVVYPEHAVAHEFDSIKPDDVVLEYGCGGGSDACSIFRRRAFVVATDVVPENVKTTRARLELNENDYDAVKAVRLLSAAVPLPFGDAFFDRVNCHGVLHHIPEPTMHEVIAEFYRVLKPGGLLYAMLYTEHLFARLQPNIEALLKKGWDIERAFSYFTDGGGIARPYSLGGGCELFEGHGFEFVSVVEYNAKDFRTFKLRKP